MFSYDSSCTWESGLENGAATHSKFEGRPLHDLPSSTWHAKKFNCLELVRQPIKAIPSRESFRRLGSRVSADLEFGRQWKQTCCFVSH